jgi:hypothetical protein
LHPFCVALEKEVCIIKAASLPRRQSGADIKQLFASGNFPDGLA